MFTSDEIRRTRELCKAERSADTPAKLLADVGILTTARFQNAAFHKDPLLPPDQHGLRYDDYHDLPGSYESIRARLKMLFVDTGIFPNLLCERLPRNREIPLIGFRDILEWLETLTAEAGIETFVEEARRAAAERYDAKIAYLEHVGATEPAEVPPPARTGTRLSRAEMTEVIERGGSVIFGGKVITRVAELPTEDEVLNRKIRNGYHYKDLVTLDQCAAMVRRKKRTLERLKTNGKLPAPSVEGGGGKPDYWDWNTIRPCLEEAYAILLPEEFPGGP